MSDEEEPTGGILTIGTSATGPFELDANIVATGRTCVLGSSGSGKSYAVGVICEELCLNGVPFAVIDSEGEHTGLKEKFEAIWVGEEPGCDLKWDALDIADMARQAPDISPLILDVSDLDDPREKTAMFVEELYKTLTERRTPYLLVVEEADKFVPQYGQRVPIFSEVARRGRKRGLGLVICSQRPSLVDKNVLSQCGNQLIGKLIIHNDLESVAQFFPGKGYPKELTGLRAGEFYAMGGFSGTPMKITIRKRTTKPGGVTPPLAKRVVKKYVAPGVPRAGFGERFPMQTSQLASGQSAIGFAPTIRAEDIPTIVKRERRFGIFGIKETVTGVASQYLPLIQVGVRIRRGLLKRRYETLYVILDGSRGKEVSIGRGLEIKSGFERLLGLSTIQVSVLREVGTDSDTSAIDVASTLGESRPTIARALSQLRDKRLVRMIEIRKKRLYRRLVDLPKEPSEPVPLELTSVDLTAATAVPSRVKEDDIREAVKGLWEGSDVDTFDTLLYPVFRVELLMGRKRRHVWLDGRSGRELVL